jgi:hypothetical protein
MLPRPGAATSQINERPRAIREQDRETVRADRRHRSNRVLVCLTPVDFREADRMGAVRHRRPPADDRSAPLRGVRMQGQPQRPRRIAGISGAVRFSRECVSRLPNLQWPHTMLASAYAQSGQLEEARKEAAEVLRINPAFTIGSWKRLAVYKDPKDAEHQARSRSAS